HTLIQHSQGLWNCQGHNFVDAIYIFVVGDIKEAGMESLRKNLVDCQCPVHMVSFNAKNKSTMKFLKELTHLTTGRFHAFAEIINKSDVILPLGFAGNNSLNVFILPSGAGVREDVFLIWQEIEQAKKTLQKVQSLILATTRSAVDSDTIPMEACLSSKLWLQKYGLKAQKVSFYDAFADCAFRHSDGIVEIKCKPFEGQLQSDAGGSTNTLGALRLAFADPGTKAIYLLTDGRPDQPLEMILTETELRPEVPIHTISFNCDDLDANTFLYEMSQATGGRYHCYSLHFCTFSLSYLNYLAGQWWSCNS
uniref:VWFA domain-containing protein n=1 Tax=Erpetoichthys calabaricus TaxID=27687 RepID=A0A8C4SYV4_ERPCA